MLLARYNWSSIIYGTPLSLLLFELYVSIQEWRTQVTYIIIFTCGEASRSTGRLSSPPSPAILKQSNHEANSPCSTLFKIVPSCFIMFHLVQTRPDLSRVVQTCPDSSRLVHTCPDPSRLDQTCSYLSRLVQTGPDSPILVQTRPVWSRHDYSSVGNFAAGPLDGFSILFNS